MNNPLQNLDSCVEDTLLMQGRILLRKHRRHWNGRKDPSKRLLAAPHWISNTSNRKVRTIAERNKKIRPTQPIQKTHVGATILYLSSHSILRNFDPSAIGSCASALSPKSLIGIITDLQTVKASSTSAELSNLRIDSTTLPSIWYRMFVIA